MNMHRNLAATVLALFAAAGLFACNRNPDQTAMADKGRDQVAASSAPADKAGDSAKPGDSPQPGGSNSQSADTGITEQVKAAMAGEMGAKAGQIQVETIGGTVILSGTIDSQASSDKAQQLASSVPGVKSIDNRLTVKAGSVG